MEYAVNYIDDHFEVVLVGKASIKDHAAYFDHLVAHEKWRPGSLVLSDETNLELGGLTETDLRQMLMICGMRREQIGSARFAAVVPKDLIYGMNRMFQAYVEPYWDASIEAFRSSDEALEWLLSV